MIKNEFPFLPEIETTTATTEIVNIKEINIENLRFCAKILQKISSSSLIESDPMSVKVNGIVHQLRSEEKSRPIDEQFPFVKVDLDDLSASCKLLERSIEKLERTSSNLVSNQQNNATLVENVLSDSLEKWLQTNSFDNIEKFSETKGVLFRRNKNALVQWDGIFNASKDCQTYLILIEVKETPHRNDILPYIGMTEKEKQKTLLCRTQRTLDLYNEIKEEIRVKKNLQSTSRVFRRQATIFDELTKIIIILASSNIRKDLTDAIEDLKNELNNPLLEYRCASIDYQLNLELWK